MDRNLTQITCPICNLPLPSGDERVNIAHIDECLTQRFLEEEAHKAPAASAEKKEPGFGIETVQSALLDAQLAFQTTCFEEDLSSFGFLVLCPYAGCGASVNSISFPQHVYDNHSTCSQCYECPICANDADTPFQPDQNTNLMTHLRRRHADSDMLRSVLVESRKEFLAVQTGYVHVPTKIKHSYTVEKLSKRIDGKECPICFDEFEIEQQVTWMDCLCVFHEHCIEKWFQKSGHKRCPLHGDDKDCDGNNNSDIKTKKQKNYHNRRNYNNNYAHVEDNEDDDDDSSESYSDDDDY